MDRNKEGRKTDIDRSMVGEKIMGDIGKLRHRKKIRDERKYVQKYNLTRQGITEKKWREMKRYEIMIKKKLDGQ